MLVIDQKAEYIFTYMFISSLSTDYLHLVLEKTVQAHFRVLKKGAL